MVVVPGACRTCGVVQTLNDIVFVQGCGAFYHDHAAHKNYPCGPVAFAGAAAEVDRLRDEVADLKRNKYGRTGRLP